MLCRDKHWDFFVYWTAIVPVIEPLIVDFYPDDHEKRTAVLSHWLAGQMGSGAIDFAYDPDSGDDPALEASEVTEALDRMMSGAHGWKTITVYRDYRCEDGEHDIQRLFVDPDPDGFAPAYDVKDLARRIADALVDAVADGRIEVSASEPYDSCRNCGGYHNVNYDCDRSDDDDDD